MADDFKPGSNLALEELVVGNYYIVTLQSGSMLKGRIVEAQQHRILLWVADDSPGYKPSAHYITRGQIKDITPT